MAAPSGNRGGPSPPRLSRLLLRQRLVLLEVGVDLGRIARVVHIERHDDLGRELLAVGLLHGGLHRLVADIVRVLGRDGDEAARGVLERRRDLQAHVGPEQLDVLPGRPLGRKRADEAPSFAAQTIWVSGCPCRMVSSVLADCSGSSPSCSATIVTPGTFPTSATKPSRRCLPTSYLGIVRRAILALPPIWSATYFAT